MRDFSHTLLKITGATSYWLDRLAVAICILFGIGILVSIDVAIFSRYVTQSSLLWPEEVARWLMIWIAFIGASVGLKRKALIAFEFLVNTYPPGLRRLADIAIKVSIMFFLVWFLIYGVVTIEAASMFFGAGTGISHFWPAIGPFIGGVIMMVHLVHATLEDVFRVNPAVEVAGPEA